MKTALICIGIFLIAIAILNYKSRGIELSDEETEELEYNKRKEDEKSNL